LTKNDDKKSEAFFVSNIIFVSLFLSGQFSIFVSIFVITAFETKNGNTDKKCKTFFVSKDSLFLSNIFCFKFNIYLICLSYFHSLCQNCKEKAAKSRNRKVKNFIKLN